MHAPSVRGCTHHRPVGTPRERRSRGTQVDPTGVRRAAGASRAPPGTRGHTPLPGQAALLWLGGDGLLPRRGGGCPPYDATDEELVGTLVAIAPADGGACVVAAAPPLAPAIDHDVEARDAL
jgi:hypothetical protein